jgi:hypothetical protein
VNGGTPMYFKVPMHVSYRSLLRKLQAKVQPSFEQLYYLHDNRNNLITTEEDFRFAVQLAGSRSLHLLSENGLVDMDM